MNVSRKHTDLFITQYIETLLWSENDVYATGEHGELILPTGDEDAAHLECQPLDRRFDSADLSDEAQVEITTECRSFIESQWADLAALDPGQAGQDFALTRNRHGTGFWDRGLDERGERLTAASTSWAEQNLYIGDDQQLHV